MFQFWINQPIEGDQINISPEGLSLSDSDLAHAPVPEPTILDTQDVEDELDLLLSREDQMRIRLLEELVSWFTGKPFKFNLLGLKGFKDKPSQAKVHSASMQHASPSPRAQVALKQQPNAPPAQNWGLHFYHEETRTESERLNFDVSGKVNTSDGREIDFDLKLHMSRKTYERSSFELKAGQALIDPLVIQMDNVPPGLAEKKIKFDLDLDGNLDDMSVPRAGSGFLVFDRNGNGQIDDGSELFGPESGHGFSELRALDSDNNGWLDENDLAFESLQIWSMNDQGDMELKGLIEANVGAIYLSSVSTEFKLTDDAHNQNGQLRESGIYMKESGEVSSIHEVDIQI